MKRMLLVTAIVLLPSLGFAFGQNKVQYKQFEWSILKSEYFDVYYYKGEEFLAERAAILADASYDSLSSTFGHELSRRIPIIIYRSQNEFQETNVTLELLGEGTGGFTEMFKNRVVLPFTGSYEDLRHVMMHELTHVFSFDMLYGGLLESIFTRQYLFALPLWFLEGLTEYESQAWDAEAEMVMRDAAITGYYFALYQDVQGYLAYKQGQSVIRYIVEKYGKEKLGDIIQNVATTRNLEKALESSIGVDSEGLTRAWSEHLKKQYWPEIGSKADPDDIATKLTDHTKDDSFTNIMPAVSPDGQKIVFLSDRSGYDDIYLMSALDGRIMRRLIKGQRSADFESFHSLRSSFSWSPDGERIALVSKSKDRDVINIVNTADGRRLRKFVLDFDMISYPAFSPGGNLMAFAGAAGGKPGIFTLDLKTSEVEALHIGALEYSGLSWSPDGSRMAFSAIEPGTVDSLSAFARVDPRRKPGRDIYLVRVDDGMTERLTWCRSEDVSPVWSPDGARIMFVSDRNGSYNLFFYDFSDSTTTQLTDVLGGIFNPTWSGEGDRLAYTCFTKGGWDVYQLKEPLKNLEALRTAPEKTWPYEAPWLRVSTQHTEVVLVDTTYAPVTITEMPPGGLTAMVDSLGMLAPGAALADEVADTSLAELYTPVALRDTSKAETVGRYETMPYRLRFTPDWVAGSFQYSSAFGLGGMTRFSISDILGNHQIYIASDFFSSIEETDLLAIYYYLARRTDYGVGGFHFKNYYYSDRSTMGTPIGEGKENKLFSERNYGGVVALSMPIDVFRRFDLDFTAMRIDREIYAEGSEYLENPIITRRESENLFIPRLSYVKDTTIWGLTGPAGGTRYSLSVERSIVDVLKSDLSFTNGLLDYRKYFRLTSRTHFAARLVGATSQGSQPMAFYLGGASTLRGYEDFAFAGNNILLANLELRYPFIEQLVMRGPIPLVLGDLRGVFFFDIGGAWNGGIKALRVARVIDGREQLSGLNAGYGFGIRMWLAYFLMKLDFAWATQFDGSEGQRVHFSLGGEF